MAARIYATQSAMQTRFLCTFALLTIAASTSVASFRDDSRYVARGPRTGYYIVRPGSAWMQRLGLQGAPVRDTSDPFNRGRGADVLAFRFTSAGVLSTAPAYIVQGSPNDFYMAKDLDYASLPDSVQQRVVKRIDEIKF